jgi:Arc/MetJ-type ribon-helix-helix transcriptional regulator
MASFSKKATFVLPAAILTQIQVEVKNGFADSASGLVHDAIVSHLRQIEEARLVSEMQDAALDPLFMQDLSEMMSAFEGPDQESTRLLGE